MNAPVNADTQLARLLQKYFGEQQAWREEADDLRILIRLVDALRKSRRKGQPVSIAPLLEHLREKGGFREGLGEYLMHALQGKRIRYSLTDNGILADADFWREIVRRVSFKVLPEQPDENTLGHVLNNVFYRKGDARWVRQLPETELVELFTLLRLRPINEAKVEGGPYVDLLYAASVLAHRISGRALEAAVLKMVPEQERLENPFLVFQRELDDLVQRFLASGTIPEDPDHAEHLKLRELHAQCVAYLQAAYDNSQHYGISIRVNQNLLRIRQQLERLGIVLDLLVIDDDRTPHLNTIELGRRLIEFHGEKNNLRSLIEESTRLTAFEITQHTGTTGEHYITSSGKEYGQMFLSAAGGGLIVGVMCIFKVLLGYLHPNLFGKAFFYSMNYAWGFIAIYLLGATLATKQPAMTAATLVKSLQVTIGDRRSYSSFADLFARLFRSQFIAFMGNVLVAFPMALGIAYVVELLSGWNLAEEKWEGLLNDLSPVRSLAVFHAAIAGVFLFLSGIIAGSVANRGKHEHIPLRIRKHPWLLATVGKRPAERLSRFYEKHWAGILSNFWFGVFMGSTVVVGMIFGLPLDIRHITFAAGNLGIALQGAHFTIGYWPLFWGILGIGVIGFVNFIVSFSLSLSLAMRSRGIPLTDLDEIVAAIWMHFRRWPSHFFFPPRESANTTSH